VDGYIAPGKKAALKQREITISGLGLRPISLTATKIPQVNTTVLKTLAGEPSNGVYGQAYNQLGGGQAGKNACEALEALIEMNAIETLMNTFILPMQQQVDSAKRVHPSININTETGRLSCRRPNLQNQPALEKDRYKIRRAFTCEEGHSMIAADYGQLELRLLAHVSQCKSMIEAFKLGGDFHSRTAIGR
jgi:DNA polymerase-1